MALGVVSERRFKELVDATTKHFRALDVTLQMNMEIAELLGSVQISGCGISFAADNVIQLKYVEVHGGLDPGIFVLKARGERHGTQVRAMTLGADGIKVGSRFQGARGVLTGQQLVAPSKKRDGPCVDRPDPQVHAGSRRAAVMSDATRASSFSMAKGFCRTRARAGKVSPFRMVKSTISATRERAASSSSATFSVSQSGSTSPAPRASTNSSG
jgi:KaiC